MISVALALYNSTPYIINQLDSIRCQSIKVDEVILVDDHSTDNTVELVTNYICENSLVNWHLFKHEKNKGYINTFSEAIEKASGEIIILCDHDDVWIKDKVKIVVDAFGSNSGILFLATSFTQIDENGIEKNIKLKKKHANNNLIRRAVKPNCLNKMNLYDIAVYNLAPGCTCAISSKLKNDFVCNVGVLPHDWTLALLAACKEGLYYLDIVTTHYRIYEKNTIGLGHINKYDNRLTVVKKNVAEKKKMLKIIQHYKGTKSEEYSYYKKILLIFIARLEALENKNVLKNLKALFMALGKERLYESVVMDLISFFR